MDAIIRARRAGLITGNGLFWNAPIVGLLFEKAD